MTSINSISIPLLLIIHIFSGNNLGINHIGLKLAPNQGCDRYFAAKNMITAFIPALAHVAGGCWPTSYSEIDKLVVRA